MHLFSIVRYISSQIMFNSYFQEGRTAVHYAVLGDPPKVEPNPEALSILLESGGKVNSLDSVCGSISGI